MARPAPSARTPSTIAAAGNTNTTLMQTMLQHAATNQLPHTSLQTQGGHPECSTTLRTASTPAAVERWARANPSRPTQRIPTVVLDPPHTHPLLGAASTAHGCKPTKARDTVFDKTDRYEGPFHTVPTTKQTVECHSTRQKTDGPHDETDAATVAQLAASWRTTGRRSKTTAPCSRTRSTALA